MDNTFCFEVEIHNPEGRGHKTTVWASSYRDALQRVTKEYGVGSNGIGCKLRYSQKAEEYYHGNMLDGMGRYLFCPERS